MYDLGGHTSEIIRLLKSLPKEFHPIDYVVADTDKMSRMKIEAFEHGRSSVAGKDYEILVIPR